jgi:two-component system, sensor histidine kinase
MDRQSILKKVLSVEDNEANQYFMQLVLQKSGCELSLAANGQEAVEKARAGKFNIIFMDLRMPVMDGLEATEIIRKDIDPTVPIVAVSAHVVSDIIEKCNAVGMNGFISKAVDMEKFEKEILAWVERS